MICKVPSSPNHSMILRQRGRRGGRPEGRGGQHRPGLGARGASSSPRQHRPGGGPRGSPPARPGEGRRPLIPEVL